MQGDLTRAVPSAAAQARAAIMRENAGGPPQDVCGYDEHMRAFANHIAAGVGALLIGISLLILVGTVAECFAPHLEALGLIPLFAGIGIWLALILPAFFQHSEFQRSHPYIQDFYTADERREAQRTFSTSLVAGLLLLFIGVVAASLSDGHGALAEGLASAAMVALLAAGAWLIVRASILLSRVNVANYNEACEKAVAENDTRGAS